MYFSDAYLNSPRQPIYINSGTIVVWIINQHSRLRSTAMMFFCLPKTHGGSPARRLFYRWPGGWVGLKPRDMARWIEGNFEIMNMYLLHPPEHFLLQNGESMVSIYIYISNEHGGLESQFLISNLLRSGCLCQEIWFDKADLKDLYLSFQVDTFDVFVSKNLEFKTVIVRIQTEVNHQRKSPYFC